MNPSPLQRLLRITSALSTGLADGGSAAERASWRARDDLGELLQEAGLSSAARRELEQAAPHLDPYDATSAPLLALPHISQAAIILSRPPPRPFPHLPPELLALIIQHALPTAPDFHERQKTLTILSYVSHQFHQIVRPILLAEIHLTRAHQLRGLDHLRRRSPQRSKDVKIFTVHLDLDDLRFVDDSTWLGCYLKPVVEWLGGAEQLWVHFDSLEELGAPDGRMDAGRTEQLFGQAWDLAGLLERRVGVVEAHLHLSSEGRYADASRYYTIVTPGPQLRRLYLPSTQSTTEISQLVREAFDEEIEYLRHPWEVLAAPQAAFLIPNLCSLLPLPAASLLQRLEITLILPRIDPLTTRLSNISRLFTQIAPSLSHLVLRIRHSAWADRQPVSLAIEEGLRKLTHLRTVAIGGVGLSRALSAAAFRKSSIQSLTLLPLVRRPEADQPPNTLHDHINGNRGLVRLLGNKKWLSKLTKLEVQRGGGQPPSAALRDICEARGIELRMPEAEKGWMLSSE